MSYIYGLDLSMSCTGVTIFNSETLEPVLITSIPTKDKETHGKRLYTIAKELVNLKKQYAPKRVIIERTFHRFPVSTGVLYRVHGIANYVFYDVEQVYYSPKEVKAAIIKGNATKELVRKKIEKEYPEISFKNDDESDAMALIITDLISTKRITWNKSLKD